MKNNRIKFTGATVALIALASCTNSADIPSEIQAIETSATTEITAMVNESAEGVKEETVELITTETSGEKYPDWSEATHSNDGALDYDAAFPQDSVNRVDIVISEDEWEKLNEDMEGTYGEFGTQTNGGGQQGGGRTRPEFGGGAEGAEFAGGGQRPDFGGAEAGGERPEGAPGGEAGFAGGGGIDQEEETVVKPIYVESQVYMNGTQWYNVGFKLKGHSSLKSSWSSGNYKLPFKLKFDEYEDEYTELDNQRFYGFKKLSFSSNYLDDTLIHEKLASETFEQAGIVAPTTAFYSIYVDFGEGPKYFGLYTAVENIDDTVIDKFGDDSGNVYEAEGTGTKLNPDTYDDIATHFEKKTNEDEADWSDIQNLSDILNSDLRTTDAAAWRESLDEVFDTDVFLTWLSVNSTIQNWDTYGVMTHNFYLYNNPETDKLTWIPWDNNEAFLPGKQGLVTLTANGVGEDWPLIRYILDDETYRATYVEKVNDFVENILDTDEYMERVEELHSMIEPYVIGEEGEESDATHLRNESSFTSSLSTIQEFIEQRIEAGESLSLSDDFEYDATATTQRGGRR